MTGSPSLNVTTQLEPLLASRGRVSARRQRSYFSTKTNPPSGLSLSRQLSYSTQELSPATWPDFERLLARDGGAGGWWCRYYHSLSGGTLEGWTRTERGGKNKADNKSWVDGDRSHAVRVYDRGH